LSAGGQSVSTPCTTTTAEADWIARSTGAGVMWAHDFRNLWEVHKYVYTGNGMDPSAANHPHSGLISRVADGATGFCMQRKLLANVNTDGGPTWTRPFAACPADNYTPPLGSAMAADRGYSSSNSYAAPVWNPVSGGLTSSWREWGWYGNARYQPGGAEPQNVKWEGKDFYLQMRVKLSAGHAQGTYTGGKFLYIDVVHAGSNQELNWQTQTAAGGRLFDLYTNFGSRNNAWLGSPQSQAPTPGAIYQPGGAYNSTAVVPNYSTTNAWCYPWDEWFTVLIHVIPGLQAKIANGDNVDYSMSGVNNTGIEVWVAKQGATSYTKIWDKKDYRWSFDPTPWGFNGMKVSGYHNKDVYPVDVTRRWTQIIFSKQFIPCPQV
jgi:hypothetical protein